MFLFPAEWVGGGRGSHATPRHALCFDAFTGMVWKLIALLPHLCVRTVRTQADARARLDAANVQQSCRPAVDVCVGVLHRMFHSAIHRKGVLTVCPPAIAGPSSLSNSAWHSLRSRRSNLHALFD